VVIPTRDRRPLLARALRSVLAQQRVDVEVVVVDDGSGDDTGAYLTALADPRLVVISHGEGQGVAAARNAGVARATGPWVAFVDDDDVWAPTKLFSQLSALSAAPSAAWACTDAVLVNADLEVMGPQHGPSEPDVADALLARNVVPGGASGVVVATSLVREVGGFDPGLATLADWDLWIRLALASPLVCVPMPLVAYRVHAGAMAHDVSRAEAELRQVAAKYGDIRAARGVEVDEAFWLWYFGQLHLRAGRHASAARAHARLAWSYRQHRRWALAAVGLVWPGVQSLRDRRDRARVPKAWRADVEAWLGPMRSLDAVPTTGG